MGFYKIVSNKVVLGINTVDQTQSGNVTEEEYYMLADMIKNAPGNMVVMDNGDGTYDYIENPNPPDPDPEIEDSEALDILLGEVTE